MRSDINNGHKPFKIDLLLYNIRSPAALEYIPWEDESLENFEERSKYFGLKLDTGKKGIVLEEIQPIQPKHKPS